MALNTPSLAIAVLENFTTVPQIRLNWNDPNTTETNYLVERAIGTGPFSQLVSLGANVITYTDTAVTFGGSYLYRVRAYKSSDGTYSNYSTIRSAGVPPSGSYSGGGWDYGIQQRYGFIEGHVDPVTYMCKDSVIVSNFMVNNGLGNIDQDLVYAENITIDNPASESLYIRRGILIYS